MGTEAVQALPTGLRSPSPGSCWASVSSSAGHLLSSLQASHVLFPLQRKSRPSSQAFPTGVREAGRGESHQGVLSPPFDTTPGP